MALDGLGAVPAAVPGSAISSPGAIRGPIAAAPTSTVAAFGAAGRQAIRHAGNAAAAAGSTSRPTRHAFQTADCTSARFLPSAPCAAIANATAAAALIATSKPRARPSLPHDPAGPSNSSIAHPPALRPSVSRAFPHRTPPSLPPPAAGAKALPLKNSQVDRRGPAPAPGREIEWFSKTFICKILRIPEE